MFRRSFPSAILDHSAEDGLLRTANKRLQENPWKSRERLWKIPTYLKMFYATGPRRQRKDNGKIGLCDQHDFHIKIFCIFTQFFHGKKRKAVQTTHCFNSCHGGYVFCRPPLSAVLLRKVTSAVV